MKDLVIFGAGGFGREVAWLVEEINQTQKQWNLLGFLDQDTSLEGKRLNGYPVLGNMDWLKNHEAMVVVAIGDSKAKQKTAEQLANYQVKFATLIHPNVRHSSTVEIGEGCIICAGNILTVNIRIGDHVIINLDCTIGHDVIVNDYVTILPSVNVSGAVELAKGVSIGTGSAIIQGLTIGEYTIVGAGAVVTKPLPANCTAVGSPAKPIKFHNQDNQ